MALTDPATKEDLNRVIKYFKKEVARLDDRIGEAYEQIAKGDNEQAEYWDEHQDKLDRITRSVTRLKKQVDEWE